MPHYLVVDCEASGLFAWDQPADAPGQPRVAQIGLIFVSHDFKIEAEHEFLIKPEGWEMSEEASKVTGLTTEYLKDHGGPIADALALYNAGIDARRVVVGHNVDYDKKCLRAENRRSGFDDRYMQTRSLDLMAATRNIVNALDKRGRIKNAKLDEACTFFGIDQPSAHSALADAHSAYQIMLKLVELGALPEPKSPYDRGTKKPKAAPPRKVGLDGNDPELEILT